MCPVPKVSGCTVAIPRITIDWTRTKPHRGASVCTSRCSFCEIPVLGAVHDATKVESRNTANYHFLILQKLHATIMGLEPNTEYAFRVCAFNLQGDGERTPPKKMMTGGMPPSAPRVQSVSMVSDDPPLKARIDWLPPEVTYNQPINAYTVYYRPIDSHNIEQFDKLEVPGTQTFAELTRLYMGKEYDIFVSAGNDDGWSTNATEKLITSTGVPDGEPMNVRYDISAGQVSLIRLR